MTVPDPRGALDFYERAFGATRGLILARPDGTVDHAEARFGDALVMIGPEVPPMDYLGPTARGGTTVAIHLYVEDVDATFARAVEAGATAKAEPADQFYGDRRAEVTDPFGHRWVLATQKEKPTDDEVARRYADFLAQMSQ